MYIYLHIYIYIYTYSYKYMCTYIHIYSAQPPSNAEDHHAPAKNITDASANGGNARLFVGGLIYIYTHIQRERERERNLSIDSIGRGR